MSFARLWAVLAILLPALAALIANLSSVDLAYHLRAGGDILDGAGIPRADAWTFTAVGQPWLDQQWGAQVILAAVYRLAGWTGLVLLRAVLVGLLFALVLQVCRVRGADLRRAAWLTLAAFVVSAVALGLRPQLFGMVLLALVLVILAVRRERPRLVWAIPVIVAVFRMTKRHYTHVSDQLTLHGYTPQRRVHNTVLIPIGGIQRAVVEALRYGESLSDDVRGIYVDVDPVGTERVKRDWETWGGGVKLVVLSSPYRSLMEPLLEYIEQVQREHPGGYVTVILPEFVPKRLWQHLLHNQHALLIKGALLFKPNVVVTSVPFHLGRAEAAVKAAEPAVGSVTDVAS